MTHHRANHHANHHVQGPQSARRQATASARTPRLLLAAGLLVALLSGCGGGGDDGGAEPAPPSLVAGAPAWGPASGAMPAGYTLTTLAEAERMAAAGTLQWVTPATVDSALTATRSRDDEALARLRAAATNDPVLADLLATPEPQGPGLTRQADGSLVWTPEPGMRGEPVVMDALRQVQLEAAHGLQMAASREQRLALYRLHWEALADEVRAALPTLEQATALAADALEQAITDAASKVVETVPNEAPPVTLLGGLPADGRARAATAGAQAAGCTTLPNGSLLEAASFTLKSFLPPVRSQGKRGSCTSFAIAAALETRIARLHNRRVDLSEQHLYSVAKGDWFPTDSDLSDGLHIGSVLGEMRDRNHLVRIETEWSYNPSPQRLMIPQPSGYTYFNSCTGYDQTCSDTNHQAGRQCLNFGGSMYCFRFRPVSPDNSPIEKIRLAGHTYLGSPGASLLAGQQALLNIQAVLQAGRPVVLSMNVPQCFHLVGSAIQGVDAFLTLQRCQTAQAAYTTGAHAMTIVGYVPNYLVQTRFGSLPGFRGIEGDLFGDGFYIVRNSWGCGWGDAGHVYMSSRALRAFGVSAYAIDGASVQNLPTLSLAADRNVVDTIGQTVRLTAQAGATITRVKFFGKLPNGSWEELHEDSNAPFQHELSAATLIANLGKRDFYATGYDASGSAVNSQVVQVDVKVTATPVPTATLQVTSGFPPTPITQIEAPATVTLRITDLSTALWRVARVEFYKGLTLLGTDSSAVSGASVDGFQWQVDVTAADAGTVVFLARIVDTAGRFSTTTVPLNVSAGPPPAVTSFTATPGTAPPGGGPVTLAWNVSGASAVSISPLGAVPNPGSVQVNPSVTTNYVLTATGNGGTTTTASRTVTVPPPRIDSFTATPASLPAGGGAVTLNWNVTGAASVVIGNGVGSVSGTGSRVVNVVGNTSWLLSATAPSGTSTATAAVTVAGDTVPPTVSLAASATTVDVPGSVTFTASASASDNIGVIAVDFFRSGTRIGTDTTPGDGFTQTVAFTTADVGRPSFTAVARDAAGNSTTSLPLVLTVQLPVPLGVDRWVAPNGNDSNPGTLAAPYLSVGKALANIGASGTVWLAPGSYPWANEINRNGTSQVDTKVLRVPDTGRVRAITRGTVTLNFGLQALGTATLSGMHFTLLASDVSDWQPSMLSKAAVGTLRVESATFGRMNNLQFSAGGNTVLTAEGDNSHEWFTPDFQGAFGRVDLGQTRVIGGRITLNRIPDGGNASARVWGIYGGSGRLSFESTRITLPEAPAGVFQMLFQPIQGGALDFLNNEIVQLGTRTSHVLAQNDHQSQVRILNTTVSGAFGQIVSLTVGGNVEVNGSTLSGGVTAIGFAGGQEPGGVAPPSVRILDSTLRNFSAHGVYLPNHGDVLVSGSTVRDNGQSGVFLGGTPNLPWVSANYTLRVQTTTFSGNGSGGSDQGGVVMAGSAGSTWDLGGFNGNGSNTLLGTASSPALRLAVPAGVTVRAVGNTWSPLVQGTNASGKYDPDVLATSGSGSNFVVGSGALRLSF